MFTPEETHRATSSHRGRVITFYSYKGGVGRSMALANVAALLAMWNRRVLVLDWDLEAPGLEKFFESDSPAGRGRKLAELRARTPGIVDMIRGLAQDQPIPWRDCLIRTDVSSNGGELSLISAGRDDSEYATRVRAIDWESMFADYDFGDYLETLRREWIAEYDFVLVDSRTGVTDVGGVCSIYLPDIVIAMFTANQQSVEGVKRVLSSLRAAHEQLPLDRFRLQLVPLPGRDESVTEHEKSQEWREIFATELADFYRGWLPPGSSPRRVLERLKIPYKPYWSFGERLPAVLEGTTDPTSVGYAYGIVAKLIIADLDWQAVTTDGERAPPLLGTNVAPAVPPSVVSPALRAADRTQGISATAELLTASETGPNGAEHPGAAGKGLDRAENSGAAGKGPDRSDQPQGQAPKDSGAARHDAGSGSAAPLAAPRAKDRGARRMLVGIAALAAMGFFWLFAQGLGLRSAPSSTTIILSSSPATPLPPAIVPDPAPPAAALPTEVEVVPAPARVGAPLPLRGTGGATGSAPTAAATPSPGVGETEKDPPRASSNSTEPRKAGPAYSPRAPTVGPAKSPGSKTARPSESKNDVFLDRE